MSREGFREYLALERNVLLVSAATFALSFGEQLWKRFTPKYLEALGAPILAIAAYGSVHDAIDGFYQYPGGWLSDRLGRRRALFLLVGVATLGYAVYAGLVHWPAVYLGLLLVMAWQSMASPGLFAVIGDALPRHRRAMGFTVQSILRRLPIATAPALGGLLIARFGPVSGFRVGASIAVITGFATLLLVRLVSLPPIADAAKLRVRGVWRTFPPLLRRLLVSDILIRTCEGLVDVFLVLYAMNVVGISAPQFGILIAVQMVTSIMSYLPVARWSDRFSRKPFVIATFLAFAAFPLAVVAADSFAGLVVAYLVAGLREMGEPSRKALIVDLVEPRSRGRSVGLYYFIRSVMISPAALAGGVLYRHSPSLPFYVASVIGLAGTALFAFTDDDSR